MSRLVPAETRARAVRSDAGQIKIQPRDFELLRWLEDMRAVTEADLAILLARWTGKAKPLQVQSVQRVIKRLELLDLVEARKIFAGMSRIVCVTKTGAEMVGGPGRGGGFPGMSVLEHTLAVARARVWLERVMTVEEWTSERTIRRNLGMPMPKGHVPDGHIFRRLDDTTGALLALEVELHDKGVARTQKILEDLILNQAIDGILYVVPTETLKRQMEAAEQLARAARARATLPLKPVSVVVMPEEIQP
jgi:hypothetical protein